MSDSRRVESATSAASITVATAVKSCRGVWIGISDDYEFSFDGASTWVQFNSCVAGTIIPITASAARKASDDTAPVSGAIVFLY